MDGTGQAPVTETVEPVVTEPSTVASEPVIGREDFASGGRFLRRQASPTAEPEVKPVEGSGTPPAAPAVEPTEVKTEVPPATIKLADGREVPIDQISEWEKGHMMQKDYTTKTQALAEERRQLQEKYGALEADPEQAETALQIYQALSRDPVGTIEQIREHYASQGVLEPKDPETLAKEEEILQLLAEKERLEQEKTAMEEDAAVEQVATQLTSLAEKYQGRFDIDKVVDYAVENGINDPDMAFKAMDYETALTEKDQRIKELEGQLQTAKANAVNEYVKNKATNSNTPPPIGAGGVSGAPPVQINPPKTLRDARKAALARLENAGS